MILLYMVILLILGQLYFRFSVLEYFQNMSHFLHNQCLDLLPPLSSNHASLQALACGKNFDDGALTQLYSSTGLIHLFVVSGSHLILLQKIVQFVLPTNHKIYALIGLALLFFYCAVCQFNPPVTRSFIYLTLSYFLSLQHRYWPKYYTLLLAGFISLAFNFNWINSLSLQMSWIAALVLELGQQKLKTDSYLAKQFLFYFSFSACFLLMGFPQVSTILVCALFSPLLEYILFPLALITIAVPLAAPIFNVLITYLNLTLTQLKLESTLPTAMPDYLNQMNWLIIFGLHLLLFQSSKKT